MSLRLGFLLALLFGALVAYLTSLNTGRVRLSLAPDWQYDVPLMALVVGAFLGGACVALFLTLLRDLSRTFRDYTVARRARREESLAELYHRARRATV